MANTVIAGTELTEQVGKLDGWEALDGRIRRNFVFGDFNAAFAFMTRVALVAEQMNHHPEWSNVYQRVSVELTTHDAGGVTTKDITMARKMDEFAGS